MKIVIDARELRTSTGRYIERLIFYLQSIDQENEYLILLKPADFDGWEPTNSRFTKIKCPYKEFTFGEQFGLLRQLRHLKPDLVHFGMTQQPLLYGRAAVTTMHDLIMIRERNPSKNWLVFTIKQQVYKFVCWYAPRRTKQIIVPSEFVKNDIIAYAHVPPEKITVTYEAADQISEPAEPLTDLVNQQFIMYVGRPSPHKNLERLIEAFASLHTNNPHLRLALIGKRDELYERLEQYVKQHDWENIIFTGFVSEGQLRWLYEHCSAYVFPSLSEGFGLPGLEAMTQGAPVISSNATSLPEVYGDAAYYFDPHDVNAIAKAIETVITNGELRTKMVAAGKKQASRYSWQKMAEQTLEVYKRSQISINSTHPLDPEDSPPHNNRQLVFS